MNSITYFFSYSRNDAEFVKRLATDLKNHGINVWLDQLDILPGARWDAAIEKALGNAEGVLIVLSNTSVASENVMDEVSYAIDQHKKVIPLLIHNCNVPYRLARLQRIDFTGNYNTGLQQLLTTLNANEGTASPVQNPVIPPQKSNRNKVAVMALVVVAIIAVSLWMLNKSSKAAPAFIPTDTTRQMTNAATVQTTTSSTGNDAVSLIPNPNYNVAYKLNNANIVFTITTLSKPVILADVNQNFRIDKGYDRRYGVLSNNGANVLCACYTLDSNHTTRCGSAPSSATLLVNDSVYTISIPLAELRADANAKFIAVQFVFLKTDGSAIGFPARTSRFNFSERFLYKIPVNQ